MITAAKSENQHQPPPVCACGANGFVFSLAAKPHPGHRLSTAVLYPGFGFLISHTATGLPGCLYDSGTRSHSWNMYSYTINNPLAFVDPTGLDPCDTYYYDAACSGDGGFDWGGWPGWIGGWGGGGGYPPPP